MLKGIIETPECYAYEILTRLGISRDAVFSCVKVEKSLYSYASVSEEYLSVEKDGENIALSSGYDKLYTQHVLLALVRNKLTKGARILIEKGISYELLAPIVASMDSNNVGKDFIRKKYPETSLEKIIKAVNDVENDAILIETCDTNTQINLVGR